MGESMADLAMLLQHVDARDNGAMGRLYAARWELPDQEHRHRWREGIAAALMALARRIAPEAYEAHLRRPAELARGPLGAA